MRKEERVKWIEHALNHFDNEEALIEQIKACSKVQYNNPWGLIPVGIKNMVQDGFFSCYYSDVLDVFRDVYGEKFNENRYLTKSGDLRHRSDEAFIWIMYKEKLARALTDMITEED